MLHRCDTEAKWGYHQLCGTHTSIRKTPSNLEKIVLIGADYDRTHGLNILSLQTVRNNIVNIMTLHWKYSRWFVLLVIMTYLLPKVTNLIMLQNSSVASTHSHYVFDYLSSVNIIYKYSISMDRDLFKNKTIKSICSNSFET